MGLLFVILSLIFMKGGTVRDSELPLHNSNIFRDFPTEKSGRGSRSRASLLTVWKVSDSGVCCRCHLEHSEEAARSARVSARLHELQHRLVSFVGVNVLFCSDAAEKDTQSSAR